MRPQPFPIIVADSRSPGQTIVSFNSTLFEFNPFEMGSWDASVYGFIPTQYLGTNMTAGNVTTGHRCVVGYDNAGFVLGTSSTLFNAILIHAGEAQLPDIVKELIVDLLTDLSEDDDDIAKYSPNPFYGWNKNSNPAAQNQQLTLVDGGEDGQNIPFFPLIQPIRNVDIIFAVDSSSDTSNSWPNGTALVSTFERSQGGIANGTGFPYIPDVNTMINLGLNNRPTFFGCNSSNGTLGNMTPLVVYLPNSPYSTYSNLSIEQLTTNDTQRDAMILNGYNIATMGNSTVDSTWPVCVACAVLSRSLERTKTVIPTACSTCFTRFCWNGTLETSTPELYAPSLTLEKANAQVTTSSASRRDSKMMNLMLAIIIVTATLTW